MRRFAESVLFAATLVVISGNCRTLSATTISALVQQAAQDGGIYADSVTAGFINRARLRHRTQGQELAAYRARVFTRLEGSVGWSRFGKGLPIIGYETAAAVRWERPGDLDIRVLGSRSKSVRLPGLSRREMSGFWAQILSYEPWFVPRSFGSEISLMGLPDRAAVHPLSAYAHRYYRYAVVDSVRMGLPGRTVRAVKVEVRPRGESGETLVSGEMWLDADSLDVVRLIVAFLGDDIWEDEDEDAPELLSVQADLEYSLHLNRFWLPHRQVLSAQWRYKYIPGAYMPATAITTFSDYDLQVATGGALAGRPIVLDEHPTVQEWQCYPFASEWDDDPTSSPCGSGGLTRIGQTAEGRWRLTVSPLDSLLAYDFRSDFSFAVDLAAERWIDDRLANLGVLAERETPDRYILRVLDYEEALDAFRFNRVQGFAPGVGGRLRTGIPYTALHARGRIGFADERVTGGVALRRDAPANMIALRAFREVEDVEPWTDGTGLGNSLKALFAGHDDADYYLREGGELVFEGRLGEFRDLRARISVERQRSLSRRAGSGVNDVLFGDGAFQNNPPVRGGDYVRLALDRTWSLGRATLLAGGDGMAGDGVSAARVWGSGSFPFVLSGREGVLALRAGALAGDVLPQMAFRVGGPATVRGFGYGIRMGRAVWSAQLDLELKKTTTWYTPVVFVDVGDVVHDTDGANSGRPLVGAGIGISLVNGWLRFDLSKGVRPASAARFDVLFRVPR